MYPSMMHPSMMHPPDNQRKTTKPERIIKTSLSIDVIKQHINKILKREHNTCKYWENINEPIWGVSFKVDESQYHAMIQTAFEISVKLNESKGIYYITFSGEMEECDQWSPLYNKFIEVFI